MNVSIEVPSNDEAQHLLSFATNAQLDDMAVHGI